MLHLLFIYAVDHFLTSSMGLSIGLPYLCVGLNFCSLRIGCAQKSEEDCRVFVLCMFHLCLPISVLSLRRFMVAYYIEGNTTVTSRTWVFPKCILKKGVSRSCLVFSVHNFLLWCPLLKNNALGSENISYTCTDESNMRYFFRWGKLLFLNSWMLFWFWHVMYVPRLITDDCGW